MKIAICDDDNHQISLIKLMLKEYFMVRNKINVQIHCYDNPVVFMEEFDKCSDLDIFFRCLYARHKWH